MLLKGLGGGYNFSSNIYFHQNKSWETITSNRRTVCEGPRSTPASGEGRVERYVIPHSVTEAAGSRGTGRKSNSCGAVQHGYSWTITSRVSSLSSSCLPYQTRSFTVCVLRQCYNRLQNRNMLYDFAGWYFHF